ncbi:GldM family protein [uncultured Winogradskyella sp.]|uniref:GldM family protein n=1 Tax=uncultured Winogradskyella sp. TaxID=395353 RepID=UPI00262FFD18|nr:GldM family protein [uncultured Winogradskyella sp.]
MKSFKVLFLIITILYSSFLSSQSESNKSYSALELKNMNIVYRGVSNPIKIVSKGKLISAEAPGLKKIDDYGNYELRPQTGKTVDIKIKSLLKNRDIITETKRLRILDLKRAQSLFNGKECYKCELLITKEELLNGKISLGLQDFLFDYKILVKGFIIKFPNEKSIEVNGAKIPKELSQRIKSLRKGDIVQILNLKTKVVNQSSSSFLRYCKISPIIIRIKN